VLPGVEVHLEERLGRAGAGVVHEHVHATERVRQLAHHGRSLAHLGEVDLPDLGPPPV
jgi:hypothetical protein